VTVIGGFRTRVHSSLPAAGVAAAAFAVYVATLTPGVTFIDSGELATVAATLGIAHPTGYPLFTLLGWLVAHVPLGPEPIVRLNVFAAACSALGSGVLYFVFRRVLLVSHRGGGGPAVAIAAGAGALLTAFSRTYWSQGLAIEVYSLHSLFIALILLAFLRAAFPLKGEAAGVRSWYLFALLVGLSFTNHMTTILLAPGLLVMYFATRGWNAASWKLLAAMAVPFLAGCTLYFYLPLRAAQGPLLDWGNPVDAGRFVAHVFGRQYRIWIFDSAGTTGRQLSHFAGALPGEMTVAGLLLAAAGAVALIRRHRVLGAGTAVLFAGCVGYSINYDIKDIDSYFLLAYIVAGMWASVGVHAAAVKASSWGGKWLAGVAAGAGVGVAAVVLTAWPSVDRSGDHLVEDYTRNMFSSLDSGAVVFSYQWDYWVSSSYYQQYVRGLRTDIAVVDKELLRRSWYLAELERRYPWLVGSARPEVGRFLEAVAPFEQDRPYVASVIEESYQSMIAALIREGMKSHAVYVTGEIEPQYTRGYRRVPAGLAFRLTDSRDLRLGPMPVFSYRPFSVSGQLENMVRSLYSDAFLARAEYALGVEGDTLEARKSIENSAIFNVFSPRRSRLVSLLKPR
jgi:hypothetical protein